MKYRFDDFEEADFYEWKDQIKEGKLSIGSMEVVTTIWIFMGSLLIVSSHYYFEKYLFYIPKFIQIMDIFIVVSIVLCVLFSVERIKNKYKLAQVLVCMLAFFMVAYFLIVAGYIFYLEDVYDYYGKFTNQVVSERLVDTTLLLVTIGGIFPIGLGYYVIVNHIKNGRGRKESHVHKNCQSG